MPRAENRKRPPNLAGNPWAGGTRNKSFDGVQDGNQQKANNQKQELLEKMKKIQGTRKEDTQPGE